DAGDRLDRIERGAGGRAGRGDNGAWLAALVQVAADGRFQLRRPPGIRLVNGDPPPRPPAETGQERRFLDRAVALVRQVDGQRPLLRLQTAVAQTVAGATFAGTNQGDQRAS